MLSVTFRHFARRPSSPVLSFVLRNVRYGLSSVVFARETGLLQVNYVRVRNCIGDVSGYKHCEGTARASSYFA